MARAGSGGWWRSARRRVSRAVAVDPADSDVDRMRLELLVRVGELSNVELDTATRLEALLDSMLPDIADACAIFLVDDDHLHLTGARHVDPSRATHLADPTLRGPFRITGSHPTARAVRAREPVLDTPTVDNRSDRLRGLGLGSVLTLPLLRRDEAVGALLLAFEPARPSLGSDDVAFAVELARRVTVSLDTGHRLEQEREVAETLQEHLLPRGLPHVVGLQLAGRYMGATKGIYVGGDWYDAVSLGGDCVAVAIGDVVGHGLPAANAMGRLRAGLHLCMVDGLSPAEALARLNRYAFSFEESEMATVQIGLLDVATRTFRFASAGHPPPLVVDDAGGRLIDSAPGVPLLTLADATYDDVVVTLAPGSTVLMYTDGLVERRGESLSLGLERLVDAPLDGRLSDALDNLLDELVPGGGHDDVAMVAARLVPRELVLDLVAEPAQLAGLRRSVRAWLIELGAPTGDVEDIIVAVNEAAANTVEHAYDDATSGTLRVVASASDAGVTITVSDRGAWRPQVPSGERGRGLQLMRDLVDDLEVSRGRADGPGTSVRLTRRVAFGDHASA